MKLYESETVELKAIYTPDLKKEIIAFANTSGGAIFIGVQDNGEIVGLDNADLVMQQISNALRDGIRPDVSMFTNIDLLKEGKRFFIKLTVSQGTKKKFENVEGAFRVILPNIHAKVLSTEDQKYLPILGLFENQKEITRSDIEEVLGIGTTHAVNMLKEMQEKKLIRKIGNGRLTRYGAFLKK